jgi:hypothetical protein
VIACYKRLIDEGFNMTFADALSHESSVAIEWAQTITANTIAENRQQVQDRGRQQNT